MLPEKTIEGFETAPVGAALAVNPEASLTFSWDQAFARGTTVNGLRIPGSNLVGGTLRFGGSYIYMPGKLSI
jgi:hypothetical protein